MSEKLSALIDNELGELERARILKQLSADKGLAQRWSRYHIIGMALRREQISPDNGLAERVAGELRNDAGAARTVAPGAGGRWRRSAPALALAASVVGILVVGGLMLQLQQETTPPAAERLAANDGMRWEGGVDREAEDALNALLVEHGEFTSASGMNGLTAYTKFVAYDSR